MKQRIHIRDKAPKTRDERQGLLSDHEGPQRQAHAATPPRFRALSVAAVCAALVLAVFAAFGGLLSSGFTAYDDAGYVTENPMVQKGLSRESLGWAFTSTEKANWHPVTWLSHMLDVRLFGLEAGKHHLTSVLLHAANAILVFLLLFRMTGALRRSALVAALFALHPQHVESVAWIAERKDVLSTLFGLLALGAWLAYVKSKKATPYALMLAFYALGLMSKPMLVTLPFVLLLLDFWPLRRLDFPPRWRSGALKELLLEKAPLFVMSAASCVITVIAQGGGGAVMPLDRLSLGERVANAALAYLAYLVKTFWPTGLAVLYPHPLTSLVNAPAVLAILALTGVTILALWLARRAPYIAVGWLWYLGTLVPVIGLVQVGVQARADRYTYIPLLGIFIAIAWGLGELSRRGRNIRRALAVLAVACLAALFAATRIQAGCWKDNNTLFEHALSVTTDNDLAHYMIGHSQLEQGRTEEAMAHLTETLRINPGFGRAHNQLGIALGQQGRMEEALAHFREALRIEPMSAETMTNLGLALVKLRRFPEALGYFEKSVREDPDSADAQNNLGTALAGAGRPKEAVEHFLQALKIAPDSPQTLNNLGRAYIEMGRPTDAIACFRKAVALRPDYAEAHHNLGAALAETGLTDEAIRHFRKALESKPDSVMTLTSLGLSLLKLNRLPEAQECFQQALQIAPGSEQAREGLQRVQEILQRRPAHPSRK
jgi:tetratricopeptide (TPR) repeat protein